MTYVLFLCVCGCISALGGWKVRRNTNPVSEPLPFSPRASLLSCTHWLAYCSAISMTQAAVRLASCAASRRLCDHSDSTQQTWKRWVHILCCPDMTICQTLSPKHTHTSCAYEKVYALHTHTPLRKSLASEQVNIQMRNERWECIKALQTPVWILCTRPTNHPAIVWERSYL